MNGTAKMRKELSEVMNLMSIGNKNGNPRYCQTGTQFDWYLVPERVKETKLER